MRSYMRLGGPVAGGYLNWGDRKDDQKEKLLDTFLRPAEKTIRAYTKEWKVCVRALRATSARARARACVQRREQARALEHPPSLARQGACPKDRHEASETSSCCVRRVNR